MYVPDEKMRINRFKLVAIPRPVDFMRRYGSAGAPSSSYTGDNRAPLPRNKVEVLAEAAYLNEIQMQNEAEQQQ